MCVELLTTWRGEPLFQSALPSKDGNLHFREEILVPCNHHKTSVIPCSKAPSKWAQLFGSYKQIQGVHVCKNVVRKFQYIRSLCPACTARVDDEGSLAYDRLRVENGAIAPPRAAYFAHSASSNAARAPTNNYSFYQPPPPPQKTAPKTAKVQQAPQPPKAKAAPQPPKAKAPQPPKAKAPQPPKAKAPQPPKLPVVIVSQPPAPSKSQEVKVPTTINYNSNRTAHMQVPASSSSLHPAPLRITRANTTPAPPLYAESYPFSSRPQADFMERQFNGESHEDVPRHRAGLVRAQTMQPATSTNQLRRGAQNAKRDAPARFQPDPKSPLPPSSWH